jgi:hypothetical protein
VLESETLVDAEVNPLTDAVTAYAVGFVGIGTLGIE